MDRTLHPMKVEYIFFLSAHDIFEKIENIPGHKINLKKFERVQVTQSIFSDYTEIMLKINAGYLKVPKCFETNNILLNNSLVKVKIKMEIRRYLHGMKKTQQIKILGKQLKQYLEEYL